MRFCIDCKWRGKSWPYRCERKTATSKSLVDGEVEVKGSNWTFCSTERMGGVIPLLLGDCSKYGQFWEAKK